ncbi:AI-2E family transporter [soil metagenome]
MSEPLQKLSIAALTLIILAIFLLGMIYGQNLLVPIVVGALLAMLLTPVMEKLMSWGVPRVPAAILSLMLIVLFIAGVFSLVSVQVYSFIQNSDELKQNADNRIGDLTQFIQDKFGVTKQQVENATDNGLNEMSKTMKEHAGGIFSATTQGMTNFFLTMIDTLLFLLFHSQIKRAFIKFASVEKQEKAEETLNKISKVAPQYLFGKLMLITFLAIVYSVGLTIIGVKYGVLLGVLAAVLSIIPFIGNMIGGILPMIMVLITQEETWPILAILGLFMGAQFIESYFLEPLIVGGKVSVNPMAAIIGVVFAGGIWGIPGMIIAIPYIGIIKILCDQVDALEPISILLADEDSDDGVISKKASQFVNWIKSKFGKK